MKITNRRAVIAATVSVMAAGISVLAATNHLPVGGPVRLQQVAVVDSPSPGTPNPNLSGTPAPTPVSPAPVPGSPAAADPSPQPPISSAPAPAPAPTAAPQPDPAPAPTFCGQAFVYATETLTLGKQETVYINCSLAGVQGHTGPGAVTVTGYIETAQGRLYRIGDPVKTPGAWFLAA